MNATSAGPQQPPASGDGSPPGETSGEIACDTPTRPLTSADAPSGAPSAAPADAAAEDAGIAAHPAGGGSADAAESAGSAARRMAYRALGLALPFGALGAALVLVAAGKTWAKGTADLGSSALPVHATGSQSTALPGALALVGLAALVAVFAVRRIGRYAVAGLLTLSGLGVIVTVSARRADHGALNAAAASATGLSHATAAHFSTTSWPLAAVTGGLLLLAAGLLALRYGSRWPAMSSKYDRPGVRPSVRARATASVTIDPDRSEDLWKALDRGEDPTTLG